SRRGESVLGSVHQRGPVRTLEARHFAEQRPTILIDDHDTIVTRDEDTVVRRIGDDVVPTAISTERVGVGNAVVRGLECRKRRRYHEREDKCLALHDGDLRWVVRTRDSLALRCDFVRRTYVQM